MAKIVKLATLRIGETFVILPNDAMSFLTEGVTIYNFLPPSEYYIFSSFDRWTHTCLVYSSISASLTRNFSDETLVIKF